MGVQEVPVAQQAEVAELLESGNVQRSTAATLMNDTSSRSRPARAGSTSPCGAPAALALASRASPGQAPRAKMA